MNIDEEFVVAELETVLSNIKLLKNDVMIVCPFHADSNPSCSVHISGHKMPIGTYHCWSCGAKGPWSKLAAELGLKGGEHYHPDNLALTRSKAMRRRREADAEQRKDLWQGHLPAGCEPWQHGKFRELSEEFLQKVGAKRCYDDINECYRIVFPVMDIHKKLIKGSVARRLDKSKYIPWLNSPGVWASSVLYPTHILLEGTKTVTLVEGPYDALRLNYYGIPTLSILGTQNWNISKISILDGLNIQKVVICMDGDIAGRKAETTIFMDLEGKIKRKRMQLPLENPALDPGNMDMEKIKALREFAGY